VACPITVTGDDRFTTGAAEHPVRMKADRETKGAIRTTRTFRTS